ncbi:unnamed protein product [Musa acuminata subsp. malaccensis]|uniref:(wild Malaysian banana) hypothetical protein n=1 Tax=Musa acuminata subsp. malaccensis TaxID=214687 RepID=A0A804I1I9_MUSAM|nr:PREDICTED: CRS2-associated factor 1, chloroplastic [Musa acuminata subsp. malaccensis]CAG1861719.1 unnamed protein product [Musa acuminata subsp. malaccensis]
MALRVAAPIPLFYPNLTPSRRPASSTELRFSRWNNANAEPFLRRRREQKEIEDDIRRHRRHQSALRIAEDADFEENRAAIESPPPSADFRSRGTPSAPSRPSIPGKASKYSKPPLDHKAPPSPSHPAFRRVARARIPPKPDEESGISVGENGIAYRIKGAPFEFQYSYTETPKVKPLALRESPFLPFGPTTMPRPWTGRAPLPPSKKKLPEFDSFQLPPPGKKGVKSIQAPGPFLAGSEPKYHAASREEILGEPLTTEEIKVLIKGCLRTKRQLNMGRDGLTHNMLENIHAHWKRRRVCKIKCKGVCTVDMDNVRQQLEEKTGGKIIYTKGGVIYLFRGRNYNYRTRPRYPLMLWKPITPVYPRLVQRVPDGLTLEEATEMRKKGRQLPPICKLGKNGVYCKLVKQVREAFEACELVRINCKDMNPHDCRKIGAKLRDLVPCVLLSFEYEHILMWRGKNWKSTLLPQEDNSNEAAEHITTDPTAAPSRSSNNTLSTDQDIMDQVVGTSPNKEPCISLSTKDAAFDEHPREVETECMSKSEEIDQLSRETANRLNDVVHQTSNSSTVIDQDASIAICHDISSSGAEYSSKELFQDESKHLSYLGEKAEHSAVHVGPTRHDDMDRCTRLDNASGESVGLEMEESDCLPSGSCLEGVMLLLRQAVDSGTAVILDDSCLDANIVYERSVALAKTAPPGPIFQHRIKKVSVQTTEQENSDKSEEQDIEVEVISDSNTRISGKKNFRSCRRDNLQDILPDVVPHGSLGVDELAKLLA